MASEAKPNQDPRWPRSRHTSTKIALAIFGVAVMIWYLWPRAYDSIRHTSQITVYEGLPHHDYEADLLKQELKSKPTIKFAGFAFYRQPLVLKPEDIETLRGLLADGGTYLTHWGEKECGGFHPDYAVEWPVRGKVYRCLICFGCSEAKFMLPQQTDLVEYDLRAAGTGGAVQSGLLNLLKKYRTNRPPHERFGIGPSAQ